MGLLGAWVSFKLSEIFLRSVDAHRRDLPRVQAAAAALGLPASRAAVVIAIAVELALVVLLLGARPAGAIGTLLYVGLLTAFALRQRLSGAHIADCGCASIPEPIDERYFARNGITLLAAVIALVCPPADLVASSAAFVFWIGGIGFKTLLGKQMRIVGEA